MLHNWIYLFVKVKTSKFITELAVTLMGLERLPVRLLALSREQRRAALEARVEPLTSGPLLGRDGLSNTGTPLT